MSFVKTNYYEFADWNSVYFFMKSKNLKEIFVDEVGYFADTLKIKSGSIFTFEEVKRIANK